MASIIRGSDNFDSALQSTVTSHTGNTSNPHSVTKAQVGLGGVDNTSDVNKPVSTAQQTALDLKATLGEVVSIPKIDYVLPIPAANIVDHDFFDNTQDAAWIDQCADKSWENEPRSTGKQYLAANYANDAAALAAVPAIVNGEVYYTGSVFNEYGVGVTTRAGSRKHPMRGVATAEAARVIIWDITSGSPEMWMVFDIGNIYILHNAASQPSSVAYSNGILVVGCALSNGRCVVIRFNRDKAVSYHSTGFYTISSSIAQRNQAGVYTLVDALAGIANNTVNSVAITYLPDAPLDDYGMRVPTIAAGTAGGVSVIKHDGSVVNTTHTGGASFYGAVHFTKDGSLAYQTGTSDSSRYHHIIHNPLITNTFGLYYTPDPGGEFYSASAVWVGDLTYIAHVLPSNVQVTEVIMASVLYGNDTGLAIIHRNPTTPSSGMVAYLTNTYNTGWMVGDIQACLVATATNTIADKSVKGITLTSTSIVTAAVATSATLLSFKDTGGSITATLGATVANGHIAWWEKVGTAWHHYVSVISAAGASTATGYIDGVSSTAVPIVNVAVAGGTGLTILTNIEVTQVRPSVTVSTPEQIKYMYETERKLFEPNAQVLLSNSASVSDLRYDKKSGMYAVTNGTNTDLFKDLVRVDSAATGSTIATPVTTLSGNRVLAPAVDIGSELSTSKTVHNRRRVLLDFNVMFSKKFQSSANDFIAQAGWVISGGVATGSATNNALFTSEFLKAATYTVSFEVLTLTAGSVRSELTNQSATPYFNTVGRHSGTLVVTTGAVNAIYIAGLGFSGTVNNLSIRESTDTLPPGFKPTKVWAGGALQEEGTDYDVTFDGFLYGISFFLEPATNIQVEGEYLK